MNEQLALRRLETFLHLLAAGLFVVTIGELWAEEHYQSTLQLVPFALCGVGLLALLGLRLSPSRPMVLLVRALMIVLIAGSLLGIYEHVAGNLEFAREVRRRADTMTLIKATLHGGAPVLAPGIFALGASITLAATYATTILAHRQPSVVPPRVTVVQGNGRQWSPRDG
jgi:hypothetical protein